VFVRTAGVAVAVAVLASTGCGKDSPAEPATGAPASIAVTSSAFAADAAIPAQFSCKGTNTSPPLAWTGVPGNAAALALVVDDPDAPGGTYRHWIVVDIPPATGGARQGQPPAGGRQLPNSAGNAGYDGPCPPSGTHHYRFTVYALSHKLELAQGATLDQALQAIDAAATARGQLVGTFAH
jgi:Raf kinase inhibitor-like YbhB/YbcL family protein